MPNTIPAVGFITLSPKGQGYKNAEGFFKSSNFETKKITRMVSNENFLKVLGYIPIIGGITAGKLRMDNVRTKFTTNSKTELTNKVWHVVRAFFEILGLGVLYLLPDLFMTAWLARAPNKDKLTIQKNNEENHVLAI